MKLTEVRYKSPTGRKPPMKKKAAPLPNPQAKQAYEGYSKGIDKTIKQIQAALKLRHGRTKKSGNYDQGPEMFDILADLQEVLKSVEADK
tara:strand:- start:86 stop:355 length:270 start_codon:yes stop_codon:yes gene_type:complete